MRSTVLFILVSSAACGSAASDTAETTDAIYPDATRLWTATPESAITEIPVCTETAPPTDADTVALVKDTMERTWSDASWVRFVGWKDCTDGFFGIRLSTRLAGAPSSPLGARLVAENDGMQIPHSISACTRRGVDETACYRTTITHETGHALALAHEHQRPDSTCELSHQGSDGNSSIFGYDDDSIMDYCSVEQRYRNGDWALSAQDRAGIRTLYGAPGHYVGFNDVIALRGSSGAFLHKVRFLTLGDDEIDVAGEALDTETMFRIVRATGNSLDGPLAYGDEFSLESLDDGRYVDAIGTAAGHRIGFSSTRSNRSIWRLVNPFPRTPGGPVLINAPVVLVAVSVEDRRSGALGYLHDIGGNARTTAPFLTNSESGAPHVWRFLGSFESGPSVADYGGGGACVFGQPCSP